MIRRKENIGEFKRKRNMVGGVERCVNELKRKEVEIEGWKVGKKDIGNEINIRDWLEKVELKWMIGKGRKVRELGECKWEKLLIEKLRKRRVIEMGVDKENMD